jgi:hypothetical protein
MCHALNVLAEVAPSWQLSHMDQERAERYEKRFSDFRFPKEEKKGGIYALSTLPICWRFDRRFVSTMWIQA